MSGVLSLLASAPGTPAIAGVVRLGIGGFVFAQVQRPAAPAAA